MRQKPRNKYGLFDARTALKISFWILLAWSVLALILYILGIPIPTPPVG